MRGVVKPKVERTGGPRAAWLLALALLLAAPHSRAATLAGVTLPDRIQVAREPLILNGAGVLTATIFGIKVYLAGLYLDARSSDATRIVQSPKRKRLVLYFFRDASRGQIIKAWRGGMRRNVVDMRPLEDRMNQLAAVTPDLKRGDVLVFDFANGAVDVSLARRGHKIIPGADFSRALLAVWLGPRPPDKDLKAALLGK
jgi:hypothetical protein